MVDINIQIGSNYMSNIFDGAFLRKQLTAKSYQLFSTKRSIVDPRIGFTYASAFLQNSTD